MASAIEPGKIRVLMVTATGQSHQVWSGRSEAFGACPDGVVTNTYEKWPFAPVSKKATRGGELQVEFTADGADGIDASDCVWAIPIMIHGEGVRQLGNNSVDFDILALGDYTTVAGVPVITARARIPADKMWSFGGDRMMIAIQDDTG